jgi:hypothetical protein
MGGYKEATCSCIKKALRVDSLPLHTIVLQKNVGAHDAPRDPFPRFNSDPVIQENISWSMIADKFKAEE